MGEPPHRSGASRLAHAAPAGVLGYSAAQWLNQQVEKRRQEQELDAQVRAMCEIYDRLISMRDHLPTAPPVEQWDGPPEVTKLVAHYLELLFPREYAAWIEHNRRL